MSLTRAQVIAQLEALVYENANNEITGQMAQDAFKLLINNLAVLGSDAGRNTVPAYAPGAVTVGQVASIGGVVLRQSHTATFVSADVQAELLAGRWVVLVGGMVYRVVKGHVIVVPDAQYTVFDNLTVAETGQLDVYTDAQVRVREGALVAEGIINNYGTIIIE
jgi:hypothetical protein